MFLICFFRIKEEEMINLKENVLEHSFIDNQNLEKPFFQQNVKFEEIKSEIKKENNEFIFSSLKKESTFVNNEKYQIKSQKS